MPSDSPNNSPAREINVAQITRRYPLRRMHSLLLLLAVACISPVAAALPSDQSKVELAENWKLRSATNEQQGGKAISSIDYQDSSWNSIHRMPATVLEILEEDGIYPNFMERTWRKTFRRTSTSKTGGIARPSMFLWGTLFTYSNFPGSTTAPRFG